MRMKQFMGKTLSSILLGVMTVTMLTTPSSAGATEKTAEVDLNGTYHARIGIQTCNKLWIVRYGYFDKGINEDYQTDADNKLVAKDAATKGTEYPGTITDAEIAGNGTYTVSIADADFSGETAISQLHIATDIPINDTIKFSNVTATINDKKIVSFDEGVLENEEKYLAGGMDVLLLNHWRSELIQTVAKQGCSEDADNGWTLLQGTGADNIDLTFTVSGFAYDNPKAQAAKETKAPTTDTTNSESSKDSESSGNISPIGVALAVVAGVVVIAGIVGITFTVRKKKKH